MIHYLVTQKHRYTIDPFLAGWGAAVANRVTVTPYHTLPGFKELPAGTYVFTDADRLNPAQRQLVAGLWDRLARAGDATRLVNHPVRSLARFDLLRHLADRGVNRFRAFRPTDPGRGWRYPVFVRQENDHTGSLTNPLPTAAALERHLVGLVLAGHDPRHLLVVEYLDTQDADGVFRKYSAFRVGDDILPRHVLHSRHWVQKDVDLLEPGHIEEVREYVRTNPHERQVMDLFRAAGIEYGRIDYALVNGAIQVWEINTNPVVVHPPEKYPEFAVPFHKAFADRFATALEKLDTVPAGRPPVPVAWDVTGVPGF